MDSNSLSHTKQNCKYHIVFAPKYRRKVAYGKIKQDIANILRMLCKRKGVKIVEAEICPDHVQRILCRYSRKNAKKIKEYIANQLQSDLEYDQMTLKEYIDPFTGEPVKHNK